MPAEELTPEIFRKRPDVVRAVENPRSPRSVLNYMCGCDTAEPEIRDSKNQDETVQPLVTIWFQSGRALDAFAPLRYSFGVDAKLPAQLRERSLRSLYCSSDGVRGRGAPVTNLSHNASFHS